MVPRPTHRQRACMRARDELAEPRVQGSRGIQRRLGFRPKKRIDDLRSFGAARVLGTVTPSEDTLDRYLFGSRGMCAATGRAERSEGLGFPRDCITPVATTCVSSPGTRRLLRQGGVEGVRKRARIGIPNAA